MDSSEESDEIQTPSKKIKLASSNSSGSIKGVNEEILSSSTLSSTCSTLTGDDLPGKKVSKSHKDTHQDAHQDGGPSVSTKPKIEEDDHSCKSTKSDSVTTSETNIPESEETTDASSTEFAWTGEDFVTSGEESDTPGGSGTTLDGNTDLMNGI